MTSLASTIPASAAETAASETRPSFLQELRTRLQPKPKQPAFTIHLDQALAKSAPQAAPLDLSWLWLDGRRQALRCLPLSLPLFAYPSVGTAADSFVLLLAGLVMLLAFTLIDRDELAMPWRLAGLAGLSLPLATIAPMAALLFTLIAFLLMAPRWLPADLGRLAPGLQLLAVVLLVDLGCVITGIDRSIALLTTAALASALITNAQAASEHWIGGQDNRASLMLRGAALAAMTVGSYLYFITSDAALVQWAGNAMLISVPFIMIAVLRIIHLGYYARTLHEDSEALTQDTVLRLALVGWVVVLSSIETMSPF